MDLADLLYWLELHFLNQVKNRKTSFLANSSPIQTLFPITVVRFQIVKIRTSALFTAVSGWHPESSWSWTCYSLNFSYSHCVRKTGKIWHFHPDTLPTVGICFLSTFFLYIYNDEEWEIWQSIPATNISDMPNNQWSVNHVHFRSFLINKHQWNILGLACCPKYLDALELFPL